MKEKVDIDEVQLHPKIVKICYVHEENVEGEEIEEKVEEKVEEEEILSNSDYFSHILSLNPSINMFDLSNIDESILLNYKNDMKIIVANMK